MSDVDPISDDARVIVLLCSSVVTARGETARPLGPGAWANLAARLVEQGLSPGSLLGLGVGGPGRLGEILAGLDLAPEVVVRQLERSAHLGIELDRLGARGIGTLTLVDEAYPSRLRTRLGPKAPPVLFTAGDRSILDGGGVAVVGSRDVDADGAAFAEEVAATVARAGLVVVSGGARGVDQLAMTAALGAGGRVSGLLPEGLERRLREPATRSALADGTVALASPYHPGAPFSAGAAMGRNKLIYALADRAVIVASAAESGGTWAGAVEALKARWVPVFVRSAPGVPPGNGLLVALGAIPLEVPTVPETVDWPRAGTSPGEGDRRAAEQLGAFDQPSLELGRSGGAVAADPPSTLDG